MGVPFPSPHFLSNHPNGIGLATVDGLRPPAHALWLCRSCLPLFQLPPAVHPTDGTSESDLSSHHGSARPARAPRRTPASSGPYSDAFTARVNSHRSKYFRNRWSLTIRYYCPLAGICPPSGRWREGHDQLALTDDVNSLCWLMGSISYSHSFLLEGWDHHVARRFLERLWEACCTLN